MTDLRKLCTGDEKCKLSIEDVDKSARVLCKTLARVNGQSMGEIISEALWEKAEKGMLPGHIKDVLKRKGIGLKIG